MNKAILTSLAMGHFKDAELLLNHYMAILAGARFDGIDTRVDIIDRYQREIVLAHKCMEAATEAE